MSLLKRDYGTPCLTKTGAGTASIKAGTRVFFTLREDSHSPYSRRAGRLITFPLATAVEMPALVAGTDYAVYVTIDGRVIASTNFTAPAGYDAASSYKVGGFHYAPGGNAAAAAGGSAVAGINPYSIWDVKFRPRCIDPRGMALVADSFWADIYLLGTNPAVDGSSKHGATIADGASPPKIPAMFGGNGATDYGAFKWWHANEVAISVGKQLLTYGEFAAAAYGVTEGTDRGGADAVTTQLDAARTSRWGLMQAAGNMWIWGRGEIMDPTANTAYAWSDTAEARGQIYQSGGGLKVPLFGGGWDYGASCGSRSVYWASAPSGSASGFGARFRCDHLVLV